MVASHEYLTEMDLDTNKCKYWLSKIFVKNGLKVFLVSNQTNLPS